MDVIEPQKSIDEVVSSVKSEGLFDQFRKECLEEFDNMVAYQLLKQRVENHVATFLSKHKHHNGSQKNTLRNDLRSHISKSDVILNSVKQLVDDVLSTKGHSFCLRINKQVDKYLTKDEPVVSQTQISERKTEPEVCKANVDEEQVPRSKVKEETVVMDIEAVEMDIDTRNETEEVESKETSKHEHHLITRTVDVQLTDFVKVSSPSKDFEKNLESDKTEEKLEVVLEEEVKEDKVKSSEDSSVRRRSSRPRVLPLKYRTDEAPSDVEEKQRKNSFRVIDDNESVSSNDIDDVTESKIVVKLRRRTFDDTDSVSSNDTDVSDVAKRRSRKLNSAESTPEQRKQDGGETKKGRPRKSPVEMIKNSHKRNHSPSVEDSDEDGIISKRGRRSVKRQCYSPS